MKQHTQVWHSCALPPGEVQTQVYLPEGTRLQPAAQGGERVGQGDDVARPWERADPCAVPELQAEQADPCAVPELQAEQRMVTGARYQGNQALPAVPSTLASRPSQRAARAHPLAGLLKLKQEAGQLPRDSQQEGAGQLP